MIHRALVRLGRAVLRRARRALRRRLPGVARPGAGGGVARRRRPRRLCALGLRPLAQGRLPRRVGRRRTNRSARASVGTRCRSCPTFSWWVATTPRRAPSASTSRGSERPERDVTVDDFIARLRTEVDTHVMSLERALGGWRSAYVSGVGRAEPGECVFCGLFAADATDRERLVVHRGTTCVVVLNLYPVRIRSPARDAVAPRCGPARALRRRAHRVLPSRGRWRPLRCSPRTVPTG